MAAAIETWQLTKNYHGRSALRAMDLTVPRDVVFGYLGPNGAGKTTTIRMLAGLLRPTAGRAEINGHDVVRAREQAQRRLGYLPGEFTGYPDLTAQSYLSYLGNLRGGVDRAVVGALAERLDLDLGTRIGAMSHGNRQKVGIIQAFMHRPELLVLDEPTVGLDPLAQREFLALVREARQQGRTVFLSSHNLYEVEAVADMGAAALATVGLAFEFGCLALAVGAFTGRRAAAIGISSACAVAAYLLYVAGELVEAVRPWQPLSPFDQALSDGPLGAGFRLAYLAMPAAAALFLAAALPVFARRDIAVAH